MTGVSSVYKEYGQAMSCEWKYYRFDQPIVRIAADTMGLGFTLRKEVRMEKPSCINPPI